MVGIKFMVNNNSSKSKGRKDKTLKEKFFIRVSKFFIHISKFFILLSKFFKFLSHFLIIIIILLLIFFIPLIVNSCNLKSQEISRNNVVFVDAQVEYTNILLPEINTFSEINTFPEDETISGFSSLRFEDISKVRIVDIEIHRLVTKRNKQ